MALLFTTGDSAYVDVGTPVIPNIYDAITVASWVYANSWISTAGVFCNNRDYNDGYIHCMPVSSNKPRFYIDVLPGGWKIVETTNDVSTGVWHWIVSTFDGRYLKIYVDDVLAGTTDLGTTDTIDYDASPHNNQWIGRYGTGYFDGIIAEVSLWNRAWPQTEVQTRKNRNLSGGESGLVGYWPIADAGSGIGVPIKDISGNGINGVMNNFVGNPWADCPPIILGRAT